MPGAGRSSGTSSADWERGQEVPEADLPGPHQYPPLACGLAKHPLARCCTGHHPSASDRPHPTRQKVLWLERLLEWSDSGGTTCRQLSGQLLESGHPGSNA